jgi:hypothetical protein
MLQKSATKTEAFPPHACGCKPAANRYTVRFRNHRPRFPRLAGKNQLAKDLGMNDPSRFKGRSDGLSVRVL